LCITAPQTLTED